MSWAALPLLAAAVVLVVGRPGRVPPWAGPLGAAAVALAIGAVRIREAEQALQPLVAPLAFLLAAVPLAVLLDRLGFFAAAAERLGRGRGLIGGLWVLAALVTILLNLDAAVVLLTPLYVRIARRTGLDPLALAFQPVLLASLASSALPVSNLTNLIAVSHAHLDVLGFVTHLGPPTVAAVTVGWYTYRRALVPGRPAAGDPGTADRHALGVGAAVVGAVLIGFVAGPSVGVEPWLVALVADVALVLLTRGGIPWRAVPWSTALIAAGLGVLAPAAATHLHVARLVAGSSPLALARTAAVTGAGANLVNNLPGLLVVLPRLPPHGGPSVWAALFGLNAGPVLVITGSLAGLLWLDAVRQLGLDVSARHYSRVGLRVGLPAMVAGILVLALLAI